MKTTKEKAKAYDEALKRARQKIDAGLLAEDDLSYIFPQLSESDDERTRRCLIEFISDIKRISESGRNSWAVRKDDAEMCNAFLSYLEKQKEQEHIIGDGIAAQTRPAYIFYNDTPEERQKAIDKFFPKKEQKPAWSEEDEKMIDTIVSVLGQYIDYKAVSGTGSGYATLRYSKEIDWLKSLRTSWKPSEEQIRALESCFCEFGEGCPDEDGLRSLYNDLKKL